MTGVELEIPKCRPEAKELALKNGRLIKVEEKRGGRPRKDLGKEDLERVEHLASLGVAQRDITPVLTAGIAERTLRDKIATKGASAHGWTWTTSAWRRTWV